MSFERNKHYLAIASFYKDKRATRSNVPLINHINEGLQILDHINANTLCKEAYCIHPLIQEDSDLKNSIQNGFLLDLSPVSVAIAMEYRSVANAYLSKACMSENDAFSISSINEVNLMLIADKVQNKKDFDLYHKETHERSETLSLYFDNWLRKLNISETKYLELIGLIYK